MSFVRFKKNTEALKTALPQKTHSQLEMRIDVVPIPTVSSVVNMGLKAKQNEAISNLTSRGKDLFMPNSTVLSQEQGNNLYQTADLFGQVLAVEDLITSLTSSDLTLRVNAIRQGSQAHATCMELKTGILADALATEMNSKSEKVIEVNLSASPEKGRMFIGLKAVKTGKSFKHFIEKVDYEVAAAEDSMLHIRK